jgi:hypothetical protein
MVPLWEGAVSYERGTPVLAGKAKDKKGKGKDKPKDKTPLDQAPLPTPLLVKLLIGRRNHFK